MYLDREEERILQGYEGEAKAKALRVIVKVGEALGASRLIRIKHAHISGVSYENIGDYGLELIESFRGMGAKFSVPTTVNPISYDVDDVSSIPGVKLDKAYVRAQEIILRALSDMGADLELTCTPYYTGVTERYNLKPGDHVAWGESNAVAYANSVLGLRTNREGGPLALMAAIAGRTYYYGMHLDEERRPRISYIVEPSVALDEVEAGLLGEVIAELHRDERPPHVVVAFKGDYSLKEFLAALGTASDIPMAYIEGVTREERGDEIVRREVISLDEIRRRLEERMPREPVDVIYIGCPHSSLEEVAELARILENVGSLRARVVISTSRSTYLKALESGLIGKLREHNVSIVRSSCLIVSPFSKYNRGVRVATNSYKAYYYLSRRGVKSYLIRLSDITRVF